MVGESLIGQLHAGLSRYALIPLYQAWLAQRGGSRPAWRAYSAGMAFRRSAMGWSDDQRREWQLRQLRRAVRDAERSTPYYAELFASVGFDPASDFDFADYAALPVLEREHIREAGDAIVTTAIPRAKLRRDATGGSTGQPTIVWRGPQDDGWSRSGTEFFTQAVGLRPGTGTAYLWGHHLDPRARASARERLQDWIENLRWYDCLRLSDETLLGYHRELQAWRPARMIAYAGALAALADVVGRLGDRPKYPTDGFVTGAEKLFGHQRARIERSSGGRCTSATAPATPAFSGSSSIPSARSTTRSTGRTSSWSPRRAAVPRASWSRSCMPTACRCSAIGSATSGASPPTRARASRRSGCTRSSGVMSRVSGSPTVAGPTA